MTKKAFFWVSVVWLLCSIGLWLDRQGRFVDAGFLSTLLFVVVLVEALLVIILVVSLVIHCVKRTMNGGWPAAMIVLWSVSMILNVTLFNSIVQAV